jgi:hypothetical protein
MWHVQLMSNALDLIDFFATPEPAALGPDPRAGVQSQSALEKQLAPVLRASGLSMDDQELIKGLILLWHDHLDAAHSIAQSIESSDGAFVHGIMHRREPDFSNAAYWFRRVGRHRAFEQIAARVSPMLHVASEPGLSTRLLPKGAWDPFAYIEACQEATNKPEAYQRLLREIQREEFHALLRSLQPS